MLLEAEVKGDAYRAYIDGGVQPRHALAELAKAGVATKGSASPDARVVLIELESLQIIEVFTSFGRVRLPAEEVACRALGEAQRYINANVPVGEHLADQLLLPLAIGAWRDGTGGTFRTLSLSLHSKTNIEVIQQFLNVEIRVTGEDEEHCRVDVVPARRSG